jgi:cellulose synthase/poly-beta-1,6-N-acetylglucosamine synthase-like glycosyltransferase
MAKRAGLGGNCIAGGHVEVIFRKAWSRWLKIRRSLDRMALPLGLIGLAGVAAYNWRQWQRDKTLLARVKEPPPLPALDEWPELPLVSVLVAAWNEADFIERHIESFLALRYPHKELLLCAGGADGTYELAQKYSGPQVELLAQWPNEGKQHALHRAFRASKGSVIYLTDADCVYNNVGFNRLLFPIVNGETSVVTGISEPLPEQRAQPFIQYQWSIDVVWAAQMPSIANGVLGRNCALHRNTIEAIGSFATPVKTGTDYVMSQQLKSQGYVIRAVPESRMSTAYPATAWEYLQMWRRWDKNLLIHGLHFVSLHEIRGVLITTAVALIVTVLPALMPVFGISALVIPLMLLEIATLNRWRRMLMGSKLATIPTPLSRFLLTPLYAYLDLVAALMATRDAVCPRFRTKW